MRKSPKIGVVVKVVKNGNRYNAVDSDGNKYTSYIRTGTRKKAYMAGMALECREGKDSGRIYWWKVPMEQFGVVSHVPEAPSEVEVPDGHEAVVNFINESYSLKPKGLVMKELKWKYLIRSAVRGKNIMMTGQAGCGKTMAAKSLVNALDRPDYYFNLGATQDPRSTLIGNVHFNQESGTFFSESLFVKAIQTENAVILLDELTRAHPDAWNILMPVLDQGQRYLRLDEADGQSTVKVADGVTFIATANIGNEYTATRVMDRALLDRFIIVEMDVLDQEEEVELLSMLFPLVDIKEIDNVASIVSSTRKELNSEMPRISTHISTRSSVEMVSLIYDGFTLSEAAEVCVYPLYDNQGGIDSERTFIKQIVQKYCPQGETDEDLFNTDNEDGDTVEI